MNAQDLNSLISKINDAHKRGLLLKTQHSELVRLSNTADQIILSELKIANWRSIGTKKFGYKGENAVKSLQQYFDNCIKTTATNTPVVPVVSEKAGISATSLAPVEESTLNFQSICICPEDHGIIREWDCPKHGHVLSKKPDPLGI